MVKGEDETILQLLEVHPQLMEMIQITHSIRAMLWVIYANKYFEEFFPEGDFKEAILTQSLVPENMDPVKN